ncbi:hypothetical protein THAOC_34129 [Thalassiosira oceanica]|uniref:Uncharacterized protein n=1 Tax=Thalassiosira oceanica TaxID=159749 RepID=K0R403_THAOC|nr:hypothetical protein THAOC_34129 [Thalassiosira oceanica]|eukprot:EJK47175.1 hypothetical protein THAOC_34129 [Thalassiosira oceanica]
MYEKASLARLRFKSTIGSSRMVDLAVVEPAATNGRTPDEDIGRLHRPTKAHRRSLGANTTINSKPVARQAPGSTVATEFQPREARSDVTRPDGRREVKQKVTQIAYLDDDVAPPRIDESGPDLRQAPRP